MADTDPYQQDSAGANALASAQSKTADAANTQKAQEKEAEAPKGGGKPQGQGQQPAQSAPAAKPGAAGAAKNALMNTPVAQGIKGVLGAFKKGGTVPETGPYQLHEGEEVVPNNGRASEYRKVFKARGDAGK